jgi:hypothetical protein
MRVAKPVAISTLYLDMAPVVDLADQIARFVMDGGHVVVTNADYNEVKKAAAFAGKKTQQAYRCIYEGDDTTAVRVKIAEGV